MRYPTRSDLESWMHWQPPLLMTHQPLYYAVKAEHLLPEPTSPNSVNHLKRRRCLTFCMYSTTTQN
jgi:hypothetical protein